MREFALLLTLVCAAVLEGAAASVTQYCTDGEPDGVITNFVCPDDNPICSIFLTDFSSRDQFLGASAISRRGICVECEDDCDCGVNEYCGIDHETPKTIPSDMKINAEGVPVLTAHFAMHAAGVSGMAIKSKCLKYEIKSKSCSRPEISSSRVPHVLDEPPKIDAQASKINNARFKYIDRPPTYMSQSGSNGFCGLINSWAPEFRKWADDNSRNSLNDVVASTGSLRKYPASCTKQVKMSIPGADECKFKGAYSTVPISSCDQTYDDSTFTRDTCKKACTPLFESYSSVDCTPPSSDLLMPDKLKYCNCVGDCNVCVASSSGCNADSNGHCGECDAPVSSTTTQPSPDPSPFNCVATAQASDETQQKEPPLCKSKCRECHAKARKTSCLCQDKTSTGIDWDFGECQGGLSSRSGFSNYYSKDYDGVFSYRLEKNQTDLESSKSYRWYQQNWPGFSPLYDWQDQNPDHKLLAQIRFQSPSIAWYGYCDEKSKCRICEENERKCSRNDKYRLCKNGKWVVGFSFDQFLHQLTDVPNPGQVLIVWVVCGIMASLVVTIVGCMYLVRSVRPSMRAVDKTSPSSSSNTVVPTAPMEPIVPRARALARSELPYPGSAAASDLELQDTEPTNTMLGMVSSNER